MPLKPTEYLPQAIQHPNSFRHFGRPQGRGGLAVQFHYFKRRAGLKRRGPGAGVSSLGILFAHMHIMRTTHVFLVIAFAASAAGSPALAQRAPASGMWAIGGSIGATVPADSGLSNGLEVAGNIENYVTPRVSIRGQLGISSWDVVGRGFTGSVKPLRLDGNIVYNWEHVAWHPYVTGGVGMYRYDASLSGASGADTHAGVDVGGGIEYFVRRRAAFTAEALYHRVDTFSTPLATFRGSFWSFDVGVKAYLKH